MRNVNAFLAACVGKLLIFPSFTKQTVDYEGYINYFINPDPSV